MSRASRKGADAERAVAKILGTERVTGRGRFETAPDVRPVKLASGSVLVVESKARGKLPRWFTGALDQAAKYLPGGVPAAVFSGASRRLVVLRLGDLQQLLGMREPGAQQPLLLSPAAPARPENDNARPAEPAGAPCSPREAK